MDKNLKTRVSYSGKLAVPFLSWKLPVSAALKKSDDSHISPSWRSKRALSGPTNTVTNEPYRKVPRVRDYSSAISEENLRKGAEVKRTNGGSESALLHISLPSPFTWAIER